MGCLIKPLSSRLRDLCKYEGIKFLSIEGDGLLQGNIISINNIHKISNGKPDTHRNPQWQGEHAQDLYKSNSIKYHHGKGEQAQN